MTPPRLQPGNIAALPATVHRPHYRRENHGVGIVHLGLGAFHRAHQACYVDDILDRAGGDWRICGVSCRSATVRDLLAPQDYLYTVAERSPTGTRLRLVQSLAEVLVAPEDPAAVIAALARPSVQLVTATVTEKAWCRDSATGHLDTSHSDIVHDLQHPLRPRSAVGLLVAGLRARRQQGVAAPTVLCCDNLPHNGVAVRTVVVDLARRLDPDLAEWIEQRVAFPSTMVDRIVPATTPEDIARTEAALGLQDLTPVMTEPFSQWVIEDRFAGPRPPLELAGAQFVGDVRPFELAKLRLLNGSHSALAYLGLAVGHHHVHEAIGDSDLRHGIERLMREELGPTLAPVAGLEPARYQQQLLERFGNSVLRHPLRQIAMDGSQKLPQRLLAPLQERFAAGQAAPFIVLVVAAWVRYAVGLGSTAAYVVDDPLAARFRAVVARGGGDAAALAGSFLAMSDIFGTDLPAHDGFRRQLAFELTKLGQGGVRMRIRELLQDVPHG